MSYLLGILIGSIIAVGIIILSEVLDKPWILYVALVLSLIGVIIILTI